MDTEELARLLADVTAERDEFTQQAQQRLAWFAGRIELLQTLIEQARTEKENEH